MRIVKSHGELSAPEIYFLTMSPSAQKMSDHKNSEIEISKYCIYEDAVKKEGTETEEMQNILSILTPDGEIFATNSPTFISDFVKMMELFESMNTTVTAIRIIGGTSKKGREYITCTYAR